MLSARADAAADEAHGEHASMGPKPRGPDARTPIDAHGRRGVRDLLAVKGSLVLFTGPCQPVNGQLSLLLPALTMAHSSIVFWALWF